MKEEDLIRLVTDICYCIGGFYGGDFDQENVYIFINDLDKEVTLNLERESLLVKDNASKMQMLALESIANDFKLDFDSYSY